MKTDDEEILWLTIDREDASINSMNREIFTEFDQILDFLADEKPKPVILLSMKKIGFIACADIKQFVDLKNEEEAFDLIYQA
ncbi:hypothetical protein [Coxiella-like endosymbiont of Rhipicephalus sanguineus]|uniref:hypothetical protein n=1 Tax=Coxiella-like endosymbiont of Rhipicephalus sanguineus TaxID=1955402 RepID=UPI002041ED51|nr:hypothetical protein [Coxiella-like endosymbiont of Rhipicephalus sanguineus]